MLKDFISAALRKKEPPPSAVSILHAAGSKTYAGFPFDTYKELNCYKARGALSFFYDDDCPVRSHFKSVISEVAAGTHAVNLQAMTGCGNSKTARTFSEMSRIGWFRELTEKNAGEVEKLANEVLNGTIDCAKYHDRNARVTRQVWDNRMWFGNDGGSHRTSAVWLIDKAAQRERLVTSEITDFDVNPKFRALCEDYSIFIFEPENYAALAENIHVLRGEGMIVGLNYLKFMTQNLTDTCIIIRKDRPDYAEIKSALDGSFDFSEWALDPAAFEKPEPEVTLLPQTAVPAPAPAPAALA